MDDGFLMVVQIKPALPSQLSIYNVGSPRATEVRENDGRTANKWLGGVTCCSGEGLGNLSGKNISSQTINLAWSFARWCLFGLEDSSGQQVDCPLETWYSFLHFA